MNRALLNYSRILAGERKPRFKSADLKAKVDEAFRVLKECELCSHQCQIDRTEAEFGTCRVGDEMSVSSWFDHMGEEPFLVPSFTIFFNSCTFSCQFCQNWEISQIATFPPGQRVKPDQLADIIDQHRYCKNVNFVGGEPTPYLPFILDTLRHVKADIPVVWNSNFYMSPTSMSLLSDVVDVYLSDFKYGNDDCALKLSQAPGYSEVIRRNHLLARADAEVVIRHLILPEHLRCCTEPILKFIAENFGDRVVINLMDQYRPCYRVPHGSQIDRRITRAEFDSAVGYANSLGLNFIT